MASSGGTLRYKLTDTSTLILEQGDLTKYKGDAIVNAANDRLLGGGGVDGAIHSAAGPKLLEACRALPVVQNPSVRCPTGDAKITEGFNLPAKWVIHTVGPIFSQYSKPDAASLLADAHKNSLALANEKQLKSVAFPAISCGVYGYPIPDAAKVALKACREAAGSVEEVAFILFSGDTYSIWKEAAEDMQLQSA
ncbi:g3035 [Coccomyxa viridis]|uniref:G3035 protein n=1 Tax=Coccomyxa viridis TaxID=1274662 RepID=A0ABP1FLV4_9CHLO